MGSEEVSSKQDPQPLVEASLSHSMKQSPQHSMEAVKSLIQVWTSDNNITVSKLAQYVALQVVLLGFDSLDEHKGRILPFTAVALSAFWFFSMGRTFAHRNAWKDRIHDILVNNDELAPFDFLDPKYFTSPPWYGRFSSTLVQLGSVALVGLAWLGVGALRCLHGQPAYPDNFFYRF